MDEFDIVESYLRHGTYPEAEKANLRRKYNNNIVFKDGLLYYKRASRKPVTAGEGAPDAEEQWRICVKTAAEKERILTSCHSGLEGIWW